MIKVKEIKRLIERLSKEELLQLGTSLNIENKELYLDDIEQIARLVSLGELNLDNNILKIKQESSGWSVAHELALNYQGSIDWDKIDKEIFFLKNKHVWAVAHVLASQRGKVPSFFYEPEFLSMTTSSGMTLEDFIKRE